MNTFASNPTAASTYARQMVDERVRDAEQRRAARAVRHERRAAARTARGARQRPATKHQPWWSIRFPHPAR